MISIVEVKRRINKLNKLSQEKNQSLFDVLKSLNMNAFDFLLALGVNEKLLMGPFTFEILKLVEDLLMKKGTIISYNPAMESLTSDQIDLFNEESKDNIGIMNNKIAFISDKSKDFDGLTSLECRYVAYRVEGPGYKKLSFNYNYVYNISDERERIITQKFPLLQMELYAEDEFLNDKGLERNNSFSVNIKNEMTLADFFKCSNPLYLFNFGYSYALFSAHPAKSKVIVDNFYLKNMNKEEQRTSE